MSGQSEDQDRADETEGGEAAPDPFTDGLLRSPEWDAGDNAFIVDVAGFEGPLDLLLAMARTQKVDLARISILALAEQYLAFIAELRAVRLELAADYLVMAAWLAYLKSRLLLPKDDGEDEPTGPEMAAALTFQLRRLEAMRESGARLMARPQLGHDFFRRGATEKMPVTHTVVYDVTLFELLSAYSRQQRRQQFSVLRIQDPIQLYSVEDARERLRAVIGSMPEWRVLVSFLPADVREGLTMRSAVASTFVASLELTKSGDVDLRQDRPFGPIYLKGGRGGR
jgi:segregation and condensation protein A